MHKKENEQDINELCSQIVSIASLQYCTIGKFLGLDENIMREVPLKIVDVIDDSTISAISLRVGRNNKNEVIRIFIDYLLISKQEIIKNLLINGYEYTKSLIIAAVAHEIFHIFQHLNKNIDKNGSIDNEGEKEARLFSIIVLINYLKSKSFLNEQKTRQLIHEIFLEIKYL